MYIIPVNPLHKVADANTSDGVVNIHIDYGNKFMTGEPATVTDFELNAFFIVT